MTKMLGKTGQGSQRTCYCCSDTHKQARRREEREWKHEAIVDMELLKEYEECKCDCDFCTDPYCSLCKCHRDA